MPPGSKPCSLNATPVSVPISRKQPFFSFRNQRLVDAGGQSYDPRDLGPYAYSSDGQMLAVRERSPRGERCLIFAGTKRLPPIELRGIERLAWLRAQPDATAADAASRTTP